MERMKTSGLWVISPLATLVIAGGCATPLEKRFQAHIDYLASDQLEGRGIDSPGLRQAALYIADQFEAIGLEPAGDKKTYFQTFKMTTGQELTAASELTIQHKDEKTALSSGTDFRPLSFSSNERFEGEVVFCGYGAVNPEQEHDDFVHADVKSRMVLVLRGEPGSWADEQGYPSPHAMLRNKVYNAKDREAAAIVFVNQESEEDTTDSLDEFNTRSSDEFGLPAFQITRSSADKLLTLAGKPSLSELQERLDRGESATTTLSEVWLRGQAGIHKKSAPTWNIVGSLPGEGSLQNEVVVIGAHYDHLGIQVPMGRIFRKGKLVHDATKPQIHNGADDNASGVSGLIEIARLFTEGPHPKREVIFVAFSGEEAGLHGSKYYVENAYKPPDVTVAMLNMDMIGRLPRGSDEIVVFGLDSGEGLEPIVKGRANLVGLEVKPGLDSGGRSDHAPFIQNRVPSLHFLTGLHSDYHKPTDDSNKINAHGGAKVAQLVYATALELANRDERLVFHEPKQQKSALTGNTPTFKVVMGLMPNYVGDDLPGMIVDGVTAEGPADVAGMKKGDRIIRISGKPVSNIYDYMAATRNNESGDTVEVVVLRNDKEVTLHVTLAPAG